MPNICSIFVCGGRPYLRESGEIKSCAGEGEEWEGDTRHAIALCLEVGTNLQRCSRNLNLIIFDDRFRLASFRMSASFGVDSMTDMYVDSELLRLQCSASKANWDGVYCLTWLFPPDFV